MFVSIFGFFFAALPAVLTRFTILFYTVYRVMPPPSGQSPRNWDHSYYALVWHTLHWQQILYQLRLLPHPRPLLLRLPRHCRPARR